MKRKRTLRQDLGLKLMALYILFVGPVVVGILYIANTTQASLESNVRAADLALARSIAQETDFTLRNALRAVRQLGSYPEVLEANIPEMENIFADFASARPDVNLVYRLAADGIMLYHYPAGVQSTIGVDFSFRDYFQRAQTTSHALISKGRISPTTQQPVATAVQPLWSDEGEFLGVVATNMRLDALSQTLVQIAREYPPEEGFNVVIIDAANQIIATPRQEDLLTLFPAELNAISQQVLHGRVDSLIAQGPDGIERLYSFVPVNSAGWGVVVSRPTAAAFATPRAFYASALITLGVFLIGGLIFWIGLLRLVVQPLAQIATYSRNIPARQAGLSVEPHASIEPISRRTDQVGHLARSLLRMEQDIEARLNELSTLLDTSAAVVSSLDTQTVLNRILEQVERLMAVRMSAIIGLDERRGIFRVQASRGLSQNYVQQIAISPTEPHSVSLRALRSGEPIQISDTETNPGFKANRPRARAEGYRSVLAIPLKTNYAPPSVLLVFRPEPHVFDEQEISLLRNFANHAAMAIENAVLYTRSDARLQEQTRRLEALIQSLDDAIILEDLHKRVIYANRRVAILCGLSDEKIIGMPIEEVFRCLAAQSPQAEQTLKDLLETIDTPAETSRSVEITIQRRGRTRWLRMHTFTVTDAHGITIGLGQLLHDITADRELDRMKSNLISTVSHELRTPLASIKGYATTLLAEDVEWEPQAQREFLTIISQETDRLSELVSDLLDLSRIDAGNLRVKRTLCDLKELIDHAVARTNPPPGDRLRLNIPSDLPPLPVDQRRIEVVLRNLIENAVKYGGEDSPITVEAECLDGKVIVRVADEGPGVPPAERERIFESFYRIDNRLSRRASGAGLGLAICKGFVQAHGGEIWLEERAKGACFAFSLPLHPDGEDDEKGAIE
ncbi:MAG: GAF domain-containing protein [Anaerolineae bacterium]|nr:MAG: GAF domain-containing protein [Anaerolineae bacterium]